MTFPKIKRFPFGRGSDFNAVHAMKSIESERRSRAVWARALAEYCKGIAASECSVFVQGRIKRIYDELLAVAEKDEA